MRTIEIYFGPNVRTNYLRSATERIDLDSELMCAVSSATGQVFESPREFYEKTRMSLFWRPFDGIMLPCDTSIEVGKLNAQKIVEAINAIPGYCAKLEEDSSSED